ncbi:MAG: ester cyclase [Solirubrobacteraceae bacterium]
MDHAASARRFFEGLSRGDIDQAIGLLAGDFVDHEELPGIPPDREGVRQLFTRFQTAFPDMRWEAQDVLTDGDKLTARSRFSGTNEGDFMGIPATGKRVAIPLIDILRFGDDGLIHEHWGVLDMLGMMQQLGVAPGVPV